MSYCTWVACTADGEYPHLDRNGESWCLLCKSHDFTLKKVLESDSAPNIMGAWIKAQGGPEAAAKRTGDKRELTTIIDRGVLGGQTWEQAAAVLLPDDLGATGRVAVGRAAVPEAHVAPEVAPRMNEERNFPNLAHPGKTDPLAPEDTSRTYSDHRQDVRMAEVPSLYRETYERLAVELALNMDDAQAVFARHGHDLEAAAALVESPQFVALLQRVTDEVRENGTSFKMKARIQAEELLATSYDMATDPLISPAVRADLIKWTSKVGGLEPKDKDEGKMGGGLTLSITFAGQAPQQVVTGHQPILIEQEPS